MPTGDVLRVAKDTVALIGNASCYISQLRRTEFIGSVNAQHPAVAKLLHDITREGNCGKGPELFSPDVHKMVTDRVDTIEAFNKAVSKVESALNSAPTNRGENHFLYKRPTMYRGRSGCNYTPYRPMSNCRRQSRPYFRSGRGKFVTKGQSSGPRPPCTHRQAMC